MELCLTGTAACFTIPAFRCSCAVCTEARISGNSKLHRKNSCAVIRSPGSSPEDDRDTILIDAPPQVPAQLAAWGIDDLRIHSLLLTHRHADHVLGLFFMMMRKSKGACIEHPLRIYMGAQTYMAIAKLFGKLADEDMLSDMRAVVDFIRISAYESLSLGTLTVTPLETGHLLAKAVYSGKEAEETFGYCITEGGHNLYYLVDGARNLPGETLDFMSQHPPDCIVADCTYAETHQGSGHGDIDSTIQLKHRFPDARVIASHICHTNLKPEELAVRLSTHGIVTGYDGMTIQIP